MSLLPKWIIANSIGWLLGVIFILILSSTFDSLGLEGYQFFLGLGISSSLSFFQWRTINKLDSFTTQWIRNSIIGLSSPFILLDILSKTELLDLKEYYLPIAIVLGALSLSFAQTLVLKKYTTKSKNWMLMSLLGWIMAGLLLISIEYTKVISDNNWVLFALNLIAIIGGGPAIALFTYNFIYTTFKAN